MHYMRSVSVRELQQNIKQVLDRVQRGESVDVTRRRRPVARIVPVARAAAAEPWPDLEKRARRALGSRVIEPPASEQLLADRGSA
jgi:prevent-host-death family protein